MIRTLTKNWLLLAVCGVLDAIIAVIYLAMQDTARPLTFHSWSGAIVLLGGLAMAAGACTVAAGVWRSSSGPSWLLALNGLALGALGVIQYGFVRFRISFLTIALLIAVMAVSAGILEFRIARILRRPLFSAAGVASIGFAAAFLALGFHWIKMTPGSHTDLVWLGAYFAFSAITMLGLAARLHNQDLSRPERRDLPALGRPRHAH